MSPYVLMVSADVQARQAVMEALEVDGIEVRAMANVARALSAAAQRRPDLVVLDLHLCQASGLDVCQNLWRACPSPRLPVMVLGRRDDAGPRIAALEMGVEDFQSLPIAPRELVLRIRAILRRAAVPSRLGPATPAAQIAIGPLTLVPGEFEARVLGRSVPLTATALRLLLAMARSGDRIRSRAESVAVVWGRTDGRLRCQLAARVGRLRVKLGGAARPIETVRGRRYRLRSDAA